ncbi:hypothetical protein KBB96_14960 [Luteolibacter ambystomatis]|uniref:SCP domain-containing protein n=1 Tax=Luteolibacter ambystomatis TaxID=2824561 RepID=A0A975G6D1_9BACT|nr:hypothetical protein [Luteolibacter ambystomatis]QUE50164.1 hypothetical protein KBB96_14960 [Luteolibacter ambystomatis]
MNFSRGAWLPLAAVIGTIPVAQAWTGNGTAPGTDGYSVDISQRNDVVSFWQSVYKESEGYQSRIGWTGSYTTGAPGTVATVFANDVERRVNFVRALCKVPASVQLNTSSTIAFTAGDTAAPPLTTLKSAAAQASAMLIARNGNSAMNHAPANNLAGWSAVAWNGNHYGDLANGFFGPGAIDAYVREDTSGVSAWNTSVGHRRWLLRVQSTNFATGDTPGLKTEESGGPKAPTNTLYVAQITGESDTAAAARYVPYPAAGYFPAQLNSPYWSLAYPGATFTGLTTVQMYDANDVELVRDGSWGVVSIATGYGDNAIVWKVPTAVAVKAVNSDTTFKVKVSNFDIPSGHIASYTYSVTLMNPEKMTETIAVLGTATPPATGSATYSFSRPDFSDAVEVGCFKLQPATWTEGAEDSPAPKVIDRTTNGAAAPLISTTYHNTGAKAFRLTLPTSYDPVTGGAPDQSFEIDRDIVLAAGSKLNFAYKRGQMTANMFMNVETSLDGGVTWSALTTLQYNGGNGIDPAFSTASFDLPTSGIARVRFRLYYVPATGGTIYTVGNTPGTTTGVYLDDISVTNCRWLEKKAALAPAAPATQVTFNSAAVGESLVPGDTWWLRGRAMMGGRWMAYNGYTAVVPQPPLPLTGPTAPPVTGATYAFTPEGAPTSYQLEVARVGSGTWTEGAETSPAPQVIDGTGTGYSLVSTKYKKTGTNSFRLGVDNATDTLDTLTVDRNIVPTATSNLTFASHRGRMLKTNFIHAEVSTDGGTTWTSVWNQPGLAATLSATTSDPITGANIFAAQSVSLASYAGQTIRLRFAFRNDVGSAILSTSDTGNTSAALSGAWIDDIAVSNSTTLSTINVTSLPGNASSFRLNVASAGESLVAGASYRLRIRAMNGASPGVWGQTLVVVPTNTPALTGFAGWLAYEYPSLVGVPDTIDSDGDGIPNWLEYAFSLDPLVKNGALVDSLVLNPADVTISLSRPLAADRSDIIYGAEWSFDMTTWSNSGITITRTGGVLKATMVNGSAKKRFLRWKITKP